jgi:hypothetical protein
MGKSSPAAFDPELAELIQYKVRSLIGNYGLTASEVPDLEQELYALTFQALEGHDVKRACRKTYADRLVASKIATIIESRSTQKRDWRKNRQLDDAAISVPCPLSAKVARQSDLTIDVRDAVSSLSPMYRKWATWFSELTEAEIIREKAQPRGKVREMRRRLAEELRKLRLDLDERD